MTNVDPETEPGTIPSRQSFDHFWLRPRPDDAEMTTIVQSLLHDIPESRTQSRPFLTEAILDHHFHRQRIADLVRSLGHNQAADFFSGQLPTSNATRKGNFGEVVASEHLVQRHGLSMPVFKLRFRDSHNMAMRGEDIIAFELDGDSIARVIVGEAKCVVRYAKSTVRDAHRRLADSVRPRPMTLSMLAEILYAEQRDVLAAEVDRVSLTYCRTEIPKQHWIVLINQDQPTDPFALLEEEETELVGDLHCVGVSLDGLTDLVNYVFENAGVRHGENDGP